MEKPGKQITAFEAEIRGLKAQMERAREREKEYADSGRAMLYLLEDLNETTSEILKAKNEWEATIDSISDPILVHDNEMRVIRCNRAYRDASGLGFKDIIGKVYYEVFPRMDGPFNICARCVNTDEREEWEEEEYFLPALGKIFKVRVYPVDNKGGGEGFFIHAMEDITEAKRAEEKLRLSEERYRGLVETSTDAIISMNAERVITQWNEAACKIFGFSREEALGKPVDIIVPAHYRQRHIDGMKSFLESGEGRVIGSTAELEGLRKDGTIIPVEVSLSALKESGSRIFTGIIREISERKRAEENLRQEKELTEHLLMIANATTHTSDLDRLMEEVVISLKTIMSCDFSLSYLWDKEGSVFQPCRSAGLGHDMLPFFRAVPLDVNLPLVARSLELRTTVVERSASFPPFSPESPETKPDMPQADCLNIIVLSPLMGKDDYLGLLVCVYRGLDGELAGRDTEVMNGISHQVSIALGEARLYKESINRAMELSRKIETIQTMHEIDKYILSTLEPREILEASARMVAKLIHCDRATISLVDKEKGGFVYSAGFGTDFFAKGGLMAFNDTSLTDVVRTARPQYAPDLTELKLLPVEARLLNEGFLSHMRVPLRVKNEVSGVLSVGAKRRAAYTPEDLSTIEKLASQIGVALENARLLSNLEGLFLGVVKTLSEAIDAKSPWTQGHSERVTEISITIGRQMGLDEKTLKDLRLAGLLHDIGKLGTYEHILDKPGKLTPEELSIMRLHPEKGAGILAHIKQMSHIIPGIKYHHENYDGTGYPEGIKGERIPLMARILSVADTVDAMGADRPYRKGRLKDAIIAELKRCSGTQFDPAAVDAFLKTEWAKEAL